MARQEKKFSELLVSDVHDRIVLEPSRVMRDAKIDEIIDKMLANPLSGKVYVIDDGGMYIGTVSTETILRLIGYRVGVRDNSALSSYRFLRDLFKENVESIMVRERTATKYATLTSAMKLMIDERLNDLPVVDKDGRLIGDALSGY